jgi:glycosyltransferase involved in cell wall biosynthesis
LKNTRKLQGSEIKSNKENNKFKEANLPPLFSEQFQNFSKKISNTYARMTKKTLGLSMIVKNESHVIERLLKSVSPIIDYWVIADTGSTDGTQEIITKFFEEKGIPGKLLQIDWRDDFSYARNKSLDEIEKHVDYGFWIDADEELIIGNFDKEKTLSTDLHSFSLQTVYGRVDYTRKNIWKTGMNFKWEGPIHELLSSKEETTGSIVIGAHVVVRPEGSSWGNVVEKYSAHAEILKKHAEETNDPRWIFYTAQSYRDSQQYENAIEWYKKRSEINSGFMEEIFVSKFMVARLSEGLGKSKNECTILYQEANSVDHFRGEAIKSLVQMYHKLRDWENAYVFSLYGLRYNKNNPYPHRVLFIDKGLYDYEMLELHSLSCFYTNRKEEGSRCYWLMRQQLEHLGPNYLSPDIMKRVTDNEQYFPISMAMQSTLPNKPTSTRPTFTHGGTKKKRKKK